MQKAKTQVKNAANSEIHKHFPYVHAPYSLKQMIGNIPPENIAGKKGTSCFSVQQEF